MLLCDLFESKSSPLYHSQHIVRIGGKMKTLMDTGKLKGTTTHWFNQREITGLSATRNPRLAFNSRQFGHVVFVLDQQVVQHSNRIVPMDGEHTTRLALEPKLPAHHPDAKEDHAKFNDKADSHDIGTQLAEEFIIGDVPRKAISKVIILNMGDDVFKSATKTNAMSVLLDVCEHFSIPMGWEDDNDRLNATRIHKRSSRGISFWEEW